MAFVPDHALYLSVLAIGEIRRGIERLDQRDVQTATTLETWLMQVVTQHQDCILPVTREVAESWGRMSAIRSYSTIDNLLAATAQVYGLTLVTRKWSSRWAMALP